MWCGRFCERWRNHHSRRVQTADYRAAESRRIYTDKIKKEQNPNIEVDPNRDFSDSNIKTHYSAWILADGTLIIKYGNYKASNFPIFTNDVNGHNGPNKWGYDIFTLGLQGDIDGIKKLAPYTYAVEKGGKSSQEILEEF